MVDEQRSVEFTVTDEDLQALQAMQPRRCRFIPLEMLLHIAAAFVATILVAIGVGTRRMDRLMVHLGILMGLWGLAWVYLAFIWSRPSPETRAWFEKLRRSPVLSKGACQAKLDGQSLFFATPVSTRCFTPDQLESCVWNLERFFLRTMQGEVLIIPKRAFASDEAWATFIMNIRTRADAGDA